MSARQSFYSIFLVLFSAQALFISQNPVWMWSLFITVPFFVLGVYETLQKRHTILRIYPIVGRLRYWMEELRPKIYQYFIESDTNGTPIDRNTRSIIYQRSKKALSTRPFGTQENLNNEGYEWVKHSMYPLDLDHYKLNDLRIIIGQSQCEKPYSSSLLNISAMSFGSLSKNAIEALSKGAKTGGFAHNTGEGGLTPYHINGGGDLIWQIGTGYFGARTLEGNFDAKKFQEKATLEQVKMIELKLSQGAKPGHGGILPAIKNTKEIAGIRGVEPHTDVMSPSAHKEFHDAAGLLDFVEKLRSLSGGKPVGIKLCVGHYEEFDSLVESMVKEDKYPDYICVDGAEGGTGAAPLEFSNHMGAPLREGLVHVCNRLHEFEIKDKITVIAAGKIFTSFDIVKALALGADAVYSARGMMLSLGCIQALVCNQNKCPTGITTQDPELVRGLVVEYKYQRVANFHYATLGAVAEMLCAMGVRSFSELSRRHIFRRVDYSSVKNYEELYPY
jgi:glutamate synthase domain-containing protein 2